MKFLQITAIASDSDPNRSGPSDESQGACINSAISHRLESVFTSAILVKERFGLNIRNRVSVWESIVAGAGAWLALNAFAYAAAPLFGISFGLTAGFFGSLLFPSIGTTVQLWIGRVVFFAAALGWSLVYRWAGRYLPGKGWFRGLLFGTGIWLISALALPLIGAIHPNIDSVFPPALGAVRSPFPGLLGLGFAGVSGIVLSVLAHQVYGVTLGILTDIRESRA